MPKPFPTTLRHGVLAALCAVGLSALAPAQAQSDTSAVLSLLPVASVVVAASATRAAAGRTSGDASAAVAVVPAVLSVTGAVLTVKAVEASARGTVIVLERVSDGVAVSIEVVAVAAGSALLSVGTAITTTVIASGVILSAGAEVLAFIPNAVGQALLFNERIG
ncbi:hypothetical protein ACFO3A_10130 [Comamonas nitrativorans]|uniref:Uncharacterized protein n=1 Tax=Comamonas nitrativorans TaxID=108437 RepID=A0ABV9GWL9_9BURK